MKVSLRGILGIKPGNAITRQYRNARNSVRVEATLAGGNAASAINSAINGHVGLAAVNSSAAFLMGSMGNASYKKAQLLRPQYNEIVARAKRIYKK